MKGSDLRPHEKNASNTLSPTRPAPEGYPEAPTPDGFATEPLASLTEGGARHRVLRWQLFAA